MNEIETKDVIDAFFAKKSEIAQKKSKPGIDRAELYAYENKIGKKLFEMNSEELCDMIKTFGCNDNSNQNFAISTLYQIRSLFAKLFQFYIENDYGLIKNPFYSDDMQGKKFIKKLNLESELFNWETISNIISRIHRTYSGTKANYLECIILLYYHGFSKAEEIVSLKEHMIDFKTNTAFLMGRTIRLSGRCMTLLKYVHSLEEFDTDQGKRFSVIPYRGSYFKFLVMNKYVSKFDDYTPIQIGSKLNRYLTENVKQQFNIRIGYKILYLCGFYEYAVKNYGEEKIKELLLSHHNHELFAEFKLITQAYGMNLSDNSVSMLKRDLTEFIKD